MKDSVYLIFNRRGIRKIMKTKCTLNYGEFATKLEISVDNKYFDNVIPTAILELKESNLIKPKIDIEVKEQEIPVEEEPKKKELSDFIKKDPLNESFKEKPKPIEEEIDFAYLTKKKE